MLDIILMLLGLAFPNSDNGTVISDNQNQNTIENIQSIPSDTGGEDAQTPPKK